MKPQVWNLLRCSGWAQWSETSFFVPRKCDFSGCDCNGEVYLEKRTTDLQEASRWFKEPFKSGYYWGYTLNSNLEKVESDPVIFEYSQKNNSILKMGDENLYEYSNDHYILIKRIEYDKRID